MIHTAAYNRKICVPKWNKEWVFCYTQMGARDTIEHIHTFINQHYAYKHKIKLKIMFFPLKGGAH